jgi:hypothetical protein
MKGMLKPNQKKESKVKPQTVTTPRFSDEKQKQPTLTSKKKTLSRADSLLSKRSASKSPELIRK